MKKATIKVPTAKTVDTKKAVLEFFESRFENGEIKSDQVSFEGFKNFVCHKFQITGQEFTSCFTLFLNNKRAEKFESHVNEYISKHSNPEQAVKNLKIILEEKQGRLSDCDKFGIGFTVWRKTIEKVISEKESEKKDDLKKVMMDAKEAVKDVKVGKVFLDSFRAAEKYGYKKDDSMWDAFTSLYLNLLPKDIFVDSQGIITRISN